MFTRAAHWLDDRLGFTGTILPVIRHPVPKHVNWWYVFGSSTLLVFVLQVITGSLLALTYVPSADRARDSLLFITNDVLFGHFLRGMHYWGASAMVVLAAVHLARVAITGSYKFPREMNWLVGVVLLLLTLGMAFTGQLLRWDQDAFWTAVVGAEQAGRLPFIGKWAAHLLIAGDTVGGQTLTRFYATHMLLIPASIGLMVSIHLYLVIRHGISEPPKAGDPVDPATYRSRYRQLIERDGVPFWPDAAWRDVVFGLVVVGVIVGLAIFLGPKAIGEPADPTVTVAYPRPDWYFLGYFALLALMPPAIEDYLIIGIPLVAIVALIAVPFIGSTGERSPKRRPWVLVIIGSAAVFLTALGIKGLQAPWSPVLEPTPIPASITRTMSPEAREGADLFNTQACLSCHTVGNVGGMRGPNLTNVEERLSRDEMTWRILNGGTNMPAYGDSMTPDELEKIVAFLESEKP